MTRINKTSKSIVPDRHLADSFNFISREGLRKVADVREPLHVHKEAEESSIAIHFLSNDSKNIRQRNVATVY
jgi:hypothetical protein